jgi:hypothetical protein
VSSPQDQVRADGAVQSGATAAAMGQAPGAGRGVRADRAPVVTAGKAAADGTIVFRLAPPLVLWWAWVIFAVINLADLAIEGRSWFSVQIAAGLVTTTGLIYACALRPRVLADERRVIVRNPFRDYLVPWGALKGVFLGDSVEFECSRGGGQKDRTIHSWALYSPRRARARAELRDPRRQGSSRSGTSYGRMPAEAQRLVKQHPSQVMAAELGRMATEARERGAADGPLAGRWAWQPFAAVLIPAAALLLTILLR